MLIAVCWGLINSDIAQQCCRRLFIPQSPLSLCNNRYRIAPAVNGSCWLIVVCRGLITSFSAQHYSRRLFGECCVFDTFWFFQLQRLYIDKSQNIRVKCVSLLQENTLAGHHPSICLWQLSLSTKLKLLMNDETEVLDNAHFVRIIQNKSKLSVKILIQMIITRVGHRLSATEQIWATYHKMQSTGFHTAV